ncbi:hypothetical protein SYNPS1DRAFT_20118, partial [Syncephalis pseudoplumigaleata]
GKTTLTAALAQQLTALGHQVCQLSIDDLYLPYADQRALAASTASPLLARRGLPGTHDIALGTSILAAFRDGQSDIRVPRYDKSLHQGAGDRCTTWTHWHRTSASTSATRKRILLFEGWCLGFCPVGVPAIDAARAIPDETILSRYTLDELARVDSALEACVRDWYPLLDLFVVLEADSLESVYVWREQQEQMLRQRTGGGGMSPEAVRSFVDVFMVGYKLWLPQLLRHGIRTDRHARRAMPVLTLTLNHQRQIICTEQTAD